MSREVRAPRTLSGISAENFSFCCRTEALFRARDCLWRSWNRYNTRSCSLGCQMGRRQRKFIFIWTVLGCIALSAQLRPLLRKLGYGDLNSFSADALYFVSAAGVVIVPFCLFSVFRSIRGRRRKIAALSSLNILGRTTVCHQCRRPLVEYNGSNCQFCGWIRCSCGACGCGVGKLA